MNSFLRNLLKDLAVKLGIGIPLFTFYYLLRGSEIGVYEPFVIGFAVGVFIDMVRWGLKKDEPEDKNH